MYMLFQRIRHLRGWVPGWPLDVSDKGGRRHMRLVVMAILMGICELH